MNTPENRSDVVVPGDDQLVEPAVQAAADDMAQVGEINPGNDIPAIDITDGGPDMIQFLNSAGERVDNEVSAPYAEYLEELDAETLNSFYKDLVLVRRIDAEAFALQRQGQLGLWPGLVGQEAAQVGCGRAMKAQDYAFPGYREHGVAWCRGVNPVDLMGMYRGVSHGGWDSNEHNFHLYTVVIGNQMLHATGYAMGVQRDGLVGTGDPDRDVAVMAFTGDGGTAQGDFNEALNFAAVNDAPVVFYIQNNHWAISEPNHRQFKVPPYKRADGFGIPGLRVDGNDILATYAVSRWALDHARNGQGPALIEAFTYRLGSHTTSDDPTKYRLSTEVDMWKEKDPIPRLRAYLEAQGMADEDFFTGVEGDADELAAKIRRECIEMPDPEMTTMFDNMYVEPHSLLEREKAEFTAYYSSLEEH